MSEARCATHDAPSTGTCARCGAFGCDHLDGTTRCLDRFLGQTWCQACRALPAVRLEPSRAARRVLLWALLGLHGVLPLLFLALRETAAERARIEAGTTNAAGRPYVDAARWLAVLGLAGWTMLTLYVFSSYV
ncbi:MAG: hypothetical protein U0228_07990 [Myxococcaceae bacterium]